MKDTGIVRPVDALGRVVIPVEIRRTLDVKTEDSLEIFLEDGYIKMKKYEPACVFCGNEEDITEIHGKNVCAKCLQEMKEL